MGNYEILIISAISWIVDIFFWAIFEKVRSRPRCNESYEKMISNTYQSLIKELGGNDNEIVNINKIKYYKAYYAVQEKGLLGPVGALESFSAFFRNFALVAFYWLFIVPPDIHNTRYLDT